MKKLFAFVAVMLIFTASYAQHGRRSNWLTIAVKGGYGNSIMFCPATSDTEGFSYDYMSPSFCAGGRLGMILADYLGISAEVLASGYQQKYTYNDAGKQNIDGTLKFSTTDIFLSLRYAGDYGFYAELGPKISLVSKADRLDVNPNDVKELFGDKFMSVAFGLGFMPHNGEKVQVSLGLRAAYCPKNFLEAQKNPYGINEVNTNTWEMKPFSAQAILEVNYFFATFGSATCGRQRIIFFP